MPSAELTRTELERWGRAFGATLPVPAFVALRGDLGTGKTTLVQAIAAGLGVSDEVTSPTYALVHEYTSPRGPIQHLDLYRLRDASQLAQLGWDDMLRAQQVVLVEWPERAGEELPTPRMELTLEHIPGRSDVRRLHWAQVAA